VHGGRTSDALRTGDGAVYGTGRRGGPAAATNGSPPPSFLSAARVMAPHACLEPAKARKLSAASAAPSGDCDVARRALLLLGLRRPRAKGLGYDIGAGAGAGAGAAGAGAGATGGGTVTTTASFLPSAASGGGLALTAGAGESGATSAETPAAVAAAVARPFGHHFSFSGLLGRCPPRPRLDAAEADAGRGRLRNAPGRWANAPGRRGEGARLRGRAALPPLAGRCVAADAAYGWPADDVAARPAPRACA